MGVLIELVVILAVLLTVAVLVMRSTRGPHPVDRRSVVPVDVIDSAPAVVRRGPWQARYLLEGSPRESATVWTIFRIVTDARGEHEEVHEIVRIDSGAEDFEAKFLAGERRAQERALLLNSSLSP